MEEILEKIENKVKKQPKANTSVSGSEALLEILIAENTEVIFGYPGGAIMPVYDALYGL